MRADHSNLPEQALVTIKLADILADSTWPNMYHSYWLKKLAALHEDPAAKTNQLIMEGTLPELKTTDWIALILKDPQEQLDLWIKW